MSCLAQAIAQELDPISFAIVDNNRMFKSKEAARFEQDLHVYIRCADADSAKYSKCNEYRDDGTVDGRLVPNLKGVLSPRKVYLMEDHDPLQDEDGSTCGKPEHQALLEGFLGKAGWYNRLGGFLKCCG